MRWLLYWILAASSFGQVLSLNTTTMPPVLAVSEEYTRTQYCKWPCECPPDPPVCPPGVSLVTDGCDCCKTCGKQLGENCTEADTCDTHKGLYCDYSRDAPRYEVGVCGRKCCEQWICDDSKRFRKASPRHIASPVYAGESDSWHNNCIIQTTPWSPCTKTCGIGISTRISNDNDKCKLLKESRLCNMRPCEVDITQHFRPGKKCLSVYREPEPKNFTISGCVSKKTYRPKYCGVCSDDRCCSPYKSKTIQVQFDCPDGTGVSWNVMWINACFCNLNCRRPNDIFADLESYHDYTEIIN
ncbi:CCN family member 4 isoform X2 [Engystomops pustulosus]|uniref:CCN family member 4 isoform X2 n=1 Tax=Engystomops pustulosus TaxID=76066 RepID=UPI003AFAA0F0